MGLSASGLLARERREALQAVRADGRALERVADCFRRDRKVVLAAVRENGLALEYAAEELRGNQKIVLAAVCQKGAALQHASEALRGERAVVQAALDQDCRALAHASEALRGDRELVLLAIGREPLALQHASAALRGDREAVLAALSRNGLALAYASHELRGDREVVLSALRQSSFALCCATEAAKADLEMRLAAAFYARGGKLKMSRSCGYTLQAASESSSGGSEPGWSWCSHTSTSLDLLVSGSAELRTSFAATGDGTRGRSYSFRAAHEYRGEWSQESDAVFEVDFKKRDERPIRAKMVLRVMWGHAVVHMSQGLDRCWERTLPNPDPPGQLRFRQPEVPDVLELP